jgi:hypothetical protein
LVFNAESRRGKDGMSDTNTTTEQVTYYGTARRVFDWTATYDREAPFALGRASVELADYADDIAHLARGYAGEGLAIRTE